jgi:hypothetical protein
MFRTLFLALGIVLALLGSYLWYLGFFSPVNVQRLEAGPYMLVGQKLRGDYGQSGKAMDAMRVWLQKRHIQCTRGFGIYFDDPRRVEKSRLRSWVGNVLENTDQGKAAEIREKYEIKTLPTTEYFQVELPFKNQASVFIGIMRAYPALFKCAQARGFSNQPVLELYDAPNKKVTYLMPARPALDWAREYCGE